jgi:hypothetical protein
MDSTKQIKIRSLKTCQYKIKEIETYAKLTTKNTDKELLKLKFR